MIAANNSNLLAFDNVSGLPFGFQTRCAGSQAAAASPYGSSIPTTTRCCFRRRAQSS
jgi:hypothetical protein